jgi:hypothetical protein
VQAPFSHVHEHESTQHHAGNLFHTHFRHAHVGQLAQPELVGLDPDDDALSQPWFSITQVTPHGLDVLLSTVPVLVPPLSNESRLEPIRLKGHDPPALITLPPRSPPA